VLIVVDCVDAISSDIDAQIYTHIYVYIHVPSTVSPQISAFETQTIPSRRKRKIAIDPGKSIIYSYSISPSCAAWCYGVIHPSTIHHPPAIRYRRTGADGFRPSAEFTMQSACKTQTPVWRMGVCRSDIWMYVGIREVSYISMEVVVVEVGII